MRAWSSGAIPIPVSLTSKRIIAVSASDDVERAFSTTSPAAVNFTAFETRLTRTWRSRVGSPRTAVGKPGAQWARSSRSLAWALSPRSATTSSTSSGSSKSTCSSSILPASTFEKSRMPLMIAKSPSAAFRTPVAYSRCSPSRPVSRSRPVRPITAFIGVRISWLIEARNSDFMRDASIAASRASASSPAVRSRSVTSRVFTTKPPTVLSVVRFRIAPSMSTQVPLR